MATNFSYSHYPVPSFSQSPFFFISGLHRNWHPSAARGLSAVTSNGLDVIDYAMGYKLVRRALSFFHHLSSRPGFMSPSLHFFLGPSFSDKLFFRDYFNFRYPSLIFGKYLSGLFSNFRRLRKLVRFSHLFFPPRAVFLIDTKRANSAANELSRLSLPLGALCGSSVDPLFIPYPVLSNYSVQSMGFFFKLFSSAVVSGEFSSNLSFLLRFIAPRRGHFKVTSSSKVFGSSVKPDTHLYFSRLVDRFRSLFSQDWPRKRKRFYRNRKRGGRASSLSALSFFASYFNRFGKRITLSQFRIFAKVRLAYFLKNPLLFWFQSENFFQLRNPHVSYEEMVNLRLFLSPSRLKVLHSLYVKIRPLFFLFTILFYHKRAQRRLVTPSNLYPLIRGFAYSNLYEMLLDNKPSRTSAKSKLRVPRYLKNKRIDYSRLFATYPNRTFTFIRRIFKKNRVSFKPPADPNSRKVGSVKTK